MFELKLVKLGKLNCSRIKAENERLPQRTNILAFNNKTKKKLKTKIEREQVFFLQFPTLLTHVQKLGGKKVKKV